MSRKIDLTGQRFGRWTVLEEAGKDKWGAILWKCRCDCGNTKTIPGIELRNGRSTACRNCGIKKMAEKQTTHGCTIRSNPPDKLYRIWCNIRNECSNPNHPVYSYFGGCGIKVCEEWDKDFVAFRNWALENGYAPGMRITRIDTRYGFYPDNCRCVPTGIEYNGKTQTIKEWSKELGINETTITARYYKGYPIEWCFYKGKITKKMSREIRG